MKKQEKILSDYLTKEEKEELARLSFEKEEKAVKQGKIFTLLSLIILTFNAITTSILYFMFAEGVIERAFFINVDFSANFQISLIIILLIALKCSLTISSVVCSALKKGARAMIAVSSSVVAFIDLLLCALQASDQFTYQEASTKIALALSIFCLVTVCVNIYMSIFTDKISKYTYSGNTIK